MDSKNLQLLLFHKRNKGSVLYFFTQVLFLKILFVSFLFLNPSQVFGQKSRAQLEKEKKENLQRISEAEKILKETETKKNATLGQLNALSRQIETKEKMIGSMNKEVTILEGEIGEIALVLNAMENDLKNLKKEYAAMIYAASKASSNYNYLVFLFSAPTFNQFIMRLQYLQQYTEARKNQVKQIEKVKNDLQSQRLAILNKKSQKNMVLIRQIEANKNLLALKEKQNSLVSVLTTKEGELRNEIAERKESADKLEKLIADLIKKEIEKTAKGKATDKNRPYYFVLVGLNINTKVLYHYPL